MRVWSCSWCLGCLTWRAVRGRVLHPQPGGGACHELVLEMQVFVYLCVHIRCVFMCMYGVLFCFPIFSKALESVEV